MSVGNVTPGEGEFVFPVEQWTEAEPEPGVPFTNIGSAMLWHVGPAVEATPAVFWRESHDDGPAFMPIARTTQGDDDKDKSWDWRDDLGKNAASQRHGGDKYEEVDRNTPDGENGDPHDNSGGHHKRK